MGEIRNFRDDSVLKPLLDAIPRNKRSKIIRRALYDYFFKDECKTMLEDEEIQIGTIRQDTIDVKEVHSKPVKEINFGMFDD